MNDIDPAKMTDEQRTELFNSFAKDIEPARKPRQTIAEIVAPWMGGVLAQRARGLDWKQIAALFEANLKLKLAPGAIERAVRDYTRSSNTTKAAGTPVHRKKKAPSAPESQAAG